MTTRRSFLLTSVKTAAAGLIVGDVMLDYLDRLTWTRTMFPSAEIGYPQQQWPRGLIDLLTSAQHSYTLQLPNYTWEEAKVWGVSERTFIW